MEKDDLKSIEVGGAETIAPPVVKLFIRMNVVIPKRDVMMIMASSTNTVNSIHERIEAVTGIPIINQQLIFQSRPLRCELRSLAEYSIDNYSLLYLSAVKSNKHPEAWQLLVDVNSTISRLLKGELRPGETLERLTYQITQFLSLTPRDCVKSAFAYLRMFSLSSTPVGLIKLYVSPLLGNRECAESLIRHFLNSIITESPELPRSLYFPVVFELCNLLRKSTEESTLHLECRSTLELLLVSIDNGKELYCKGFNMIEHILPLVIDLARILSTDLLPRRELSESSVGALPDFTLFTAFLLSVSKVILDKAEFSCPISKHVLYDMKILHVKFSLLLLKMDQCLSQVDENIGDIKTSCSHYLAILKGLYCLSKLYRDAEDEFWTVLRGRKSALCALIVRYANRSEDNRWLLEHKDVTDFESRRHLVILLFSEAREYSELPGMDFVWSQSLQSSFQHISCAFFKKPHGYLLMKSDNVEAVSTCVLRKWIFMVCQEIFNPKKALFAACPNDCRRFYPNPVQVGVVFDRVFFLQLAGRSISLEDTRDADPGMYRRLKQILEMDAELIDSDDLKLRFVREAGELGFSKLVELCPGGNSRVVNSKNREEYIDLLIQHQFVKSISKQVLYFAQGFADTLCKPSHPELFFRSLELEDLDLMLLGKESGMRV